MFRFVDNVRMFRVGNFITLFTLVLLLAGAGATIFTFKSVADIASVWRDFDSGLARRIDLLGHFEHYLGYSGLAQHWPGAVAGNAAAKQAARRSPGEGPRRLSRFPQRQSVRAGKNRSRGPGKNARTPMNAAWPVPRKRSTRPPPPRRSPASRKPLAEHRKAGADAVEEAIWALSAKVGGVMFAAGAILAVFGLFTFWFIRFRVALPLAEINSTMTGLLTGNTRVDIPFTAKTDEVGEMARAVQVFKDNAVVKQRMEGQKQEVTQSVRATTEELAQLTKTVRAATAEQATASSSMAAATEQLTVSIDHVAENADRALTVTRETVMAVKDGEKAVQETIAVMEETARLVVHATERGGRTGQAKRAHPGNRIHHPGHRQADRPAGAERLHRIGARRRSGQGVFGGCR